MRFARVFVFLPVLCLTLLVRDLSFSSTVMAAGQEAAAQLPAGPGRDITVSTCSKCHSLANITSQHKDRDAWNATITKMVGYGATASDEDLAQILDYLTKNYGKDSVPPAAAGTMPGATTGEKQTTATPGTDTPIKSAPSKREQLDQSGTDRIPFAATIRDVTDADLLKPLKDDWLTYNGDYTSKRYSALTQVDRKSVKNLSFAWSKKIRTRG